MTIYTVYAPPLKANEAAPNPERFEFVRDGFYFWAFVFGPVWLLMKRLWLSLLFFILVVAVLQAGLWLIKVPPVAHSLATLLMHLLVGLEAATLQRWTLERKYWTNLGVVSGRNYSEVERRFFDVWVTQMAWQSARAAPAQPVPVGMPPDSSDIIGLFPEPQSRL